MIELLMQINEHKDKNDINICYELYNYIFTNKISSLEELKKCEDQNFTTGDISERNRIKYLAYASDITHLEKLDQNIISKAMKLRNLYKNSSDEKAKTKYLIKIYNLIEWYMVFPYTAYQLIIRDELN